MTKCESLAAKLRHRVTLQGKTTEGDGQGGFAETWGDVADLWVNLDPLKGVERIQAQQLQTPNTHRVLLRYRSGITTAMRLRYGTRIFDIKEVINEGEGNRTLRLMCIETM